MISIEQIELMFADMQANPLLNVDGDLLWGYFFTDNDPEKLKNLRDDLVNSGYQFVDLYPTDEGDTYFLHVEKIEHHSPQSLCELNRIFDKLADQHNIDSYDGMDVGPIL